MLPGAASAPSAPEVLSPGPFREMRGPDASPLPGQRGAQILKILQTVLPALATAYAAKKGAAGSLMDSFLGGQQAHAEQGRREARDTADESYRRDTLGLQREQFELAQQQAAQEMEQRRALEAQRAEAQAAAEAERRNQIIGQAMTERFNVNPKFYEDVMERGVAEGFSFELPGIGTVNLREAMEAFYQHGEPPKPAPKQKRSSFNTT